MPTVRDDCLDAIFEFMSNYDWASEEIFDSYNDGNLATKYYAIVLPKKSSYIENSCEWICGGKGDDYEGLKRTVTDYMPSLLIFIYIQKEKTDEKPFIIDAFFDVGVEDAASFADQIPQELSEKIIKASAKSFE